MEPLTSLATRQLYATGTLRVILGRSVSFDVFSGCIFSEALFSICQDHVVSWLVIF